MTDLERGGHEHLTDGTDHGTALNKIRTAGSISISPELFEKIYLSPQNQIKGDLRKTFGNPTPIALGGFLLALSPLSCDLLGWRGAGGLGSAGIGTYFSFGAVLMFTGGLFELILGNTFPAVVFTTFGAFWFTFGATLVPSFSAQANYSAAGSGFGGQTQFYNSFAFFLVFMGLLCVIYLIASVRTNLIFFLIFVTLILAFPFLAASFWYLGQGEMAKSMTMQLGGGGCVFATSMLGWYLFFVQILASVDFPIALPVFDLSTMVKGASARQKGE